MFTARVRVRVRILGLGLVISRLCFCVVLFPLSYNELKV